MGCGSSREARADPDITSSVPPTRTNDAAGITSQTAINAQPSTTTSRNQFNQRFAASSSNISTPRASSIGHHRHQEPEELSLTEHYNVPLVAPKSWTSTDRSWTRTQLQREREDFFETRVTGRQEIWSALKEVAKLIRQRDLADAQGILSAADITLPTGRLEEGAYDERGMLYRLPENIISDPTNIVDDDGETMIGEVALSKKIEAGEEIAPQQTDGVVQEKVDKGKDAIEKDAMKVRCRLSDRGGPDTIVLLGQTQPVSVLVRRMRSEATIPSSSRVKMVYFGKILDESSSLQDQGWQPGHVVQALVSNFAT